MTKIHLLRSQKVSDPEHLVNGLSGADFLACQISRSPSPSELGRITLPTLCLDFASLGPSMTFTGTSPKGCYSFAFVLKSPKPSRIFNMNLTYGEGFVGLFPPGNTMDIVTSEGYAVLHLTVSTPRFLEAAAFYCPDLPEKVLVENTGIRVDPIIMDGMQRLLHQLKLAEKIPSETPGAANATRHLEDDLLAHFFTALNNGLSHQTPHIQERSSRRIKRYVHARDFIVAHLESPMRLADISAETGLSNRGIQNLFHDFIGIEPLTFLRHQRLHKVRRTLAHAISGPGIIKEAALSNGFWHLGNFAHYYRELFGELPQETLARDPR